MAAVLQVNDDGSVQALVARGEGQGATGHAVPHSRVLCQGFTQVAPGLWVLPWPAPLQKRTKHTVTTRGQ